MVRRRRQLPWLQGEASVAGFQRMFEGRHPNTGELLGRAYGKGAVPAFDVVLRPTKSVSVLFGLGDPVTGRAVLDAHHVGVREAVAYLDQHLGTRRGHGGVQHVSGQGLLAVGFDHRTSREGDPLLHTHLVVANRIQGPDTRPPLLVQAHPGPTADAKARLDLRSQFFTSRGFAVVEVNYAGSTGYGRAYRERLTGQWGVLDVADCLDAARS